MQKHYTKHPRKRTTDIGGHYIMTEKEYTDLYQSERPKLVKYCERLLGVDFRADAEDCVQEVFTTLWAKRETVKNPKEYIYSAANRQAAKLRELGQRYDQWGMPIELEKAMN
jgi:DNA-directed RNA polymerase specialized sigma24 family protein